MIEQISARQDEALQAIGNAGDATALEGLRVQWLGRKSPLTQILRGIGELPPEQRGPMGQAANLAKAAIEAALEARTVAVSSARYSQLADTEWIDVTAPGQKPAEGHLHPITTIQYEIEDLFRGMGFSIWRGPQVEDEFHNFTALNIPADHPARDMHDTFWLKDGNLLRTHTSAVQIRAMERLTPPFRGIAPGRVFRHEATDASHENTFYQVEGLMVDRHISVADLIGVMKQLLSGIFKRDVTVRLRPGFFPFVEPGFELDIRCLICGGEGCSVCKQVGWVELLPCGLVHPNVLRLGGIDPDEWQGFAFGLGFDRLVMMRYGIHDIRYFQAGDLRFLEQF
ncbi:MAG: phenylalanine--tRNA ligase subunit alpha [Candidatus Sericytochromatia bacterium]|nr:phenylalanine--tRNA ligase subunit alpha [Candidatus Sericytochromatia bacterium]